MSGLHGRGWKHWLTHLGREVILVRQLWGELKNLFFVKDLHSFYTCFYKHDFSKGVNEIKRSCSAEDSNMDISEDTFLRVFKAISARKICGPDGACRRVLKHWAKELRAIFLFIFQASIDLCKIPDIENSHIKDKILPL